MRLVWSCVAEKVVVGKRFAVVVAAVALIVVDAFVTLGLASMRFRRTSFAVAVGFVGGRDVGLGVVALGRLDERGLGGMLVRGSGTLSLGPSFGGVGCEDCPGGVAMVPFGLEI